jgi:hypothetical protein
MSKIPIPVVLFAYNRPQHLQRTLNCLRENNVPLIYAFVDGPKTSAMASRVDEVCEILRRVDWCEIHVVENKTNLGLGVSILTGVNQVFKNHEMLIVFEDDLIFVPGTYQYLCAALEHYKDDPKVMSVTGWTHPRTTPSTVKDQPYFDGRSESWSWGTWARAWQGMEQDAAAMANSCIKQNIDIYRYGADLPEMVKVEKEKNIWAVRFSFLHFLHGGLCLRPPHSMVTHAGFDEQGTNATGSSKWELNDLQKISVMPHPWPQSIENPECAKLWQKECGARSTVNNVMIRWILEKGRHVFDKIRKHRKHL